MNNPAGIYHVIVKTLAGATRLELDGLWKGMSYTQTRNRADKISIGFDMQKLEKFARDNAEVLSAALAVGLNEVFIYRGLNCTAAGRVEYLQGSAGNTETGLELQASGWLDLFASRFTGSSVTYTATDASTIMMDLITTSQALTNGNEGVTQGTLRSTLPRTITYEYKQLKEAFIQLSEAYGSFDFEFTYDKKLNTYPRIGNPTPRELSYPGNLKSISLPFDGKNMINKAIMRGQGFGTEQLVSTRNDTAAQAAYKLRERIIDYSDIKETVSLDKHGDEALRLFALPTSIPSVVLKENSNSLVFSRDINIGDVITIRTPFSDYLKQAAGITYRIEQINVNVTADELETVTLRLSNA